MNYTENYHLPQWVKSDRIMMEDFNAAMSSIEGGLTTGGRAKAQAENICRDAYRQEVQLRLRHGVGGTLDAMWVNPLSSREDAGGDSHAWNGKYGVWLGVGILPTYDGIAKTAKEESYIVVNYSSNDVLHARTTFTSDGYGTLESVMVWNSEFSNSSGTNRTYTIRLFRLDTGELVKEAGPFILENNKTFMLNRTDFPLEANISYRLEMSLPEDTPYRGRLGFRLATKEFPDTKKEGLVIGPRSADSTIVKQIDVPENTRKAIGIVRWQGMGEISLCAGERVGMIFRTRDSVNALGQPCKETEYILDGLVNGAAEIVLEMSKGEGDLQVFDYGLIWQ